MLLKNNYMKKSLMTLLLLVTVIVGIPQNGWTSDMSAEDQRKLEIVLTNSIRSGDIVFEKNNRYTFDVIGNSFFNNNADDKACFVLKLMDVNVQVLPNSLTSKIFTLMGAISSKNGQAIGSALGDISVFTSGIRLDPVIFVFEYKILDNLAVGFSTDLWIEPNMMYIGLNWSNALYAKYLLWFRDNMDLFLIPGLAFTINMFAVDFATFMSNMNVEEDDDEIIEIKNISDAWNVNVFLKEAFSYRTNDIPYLKWFISEISVANTSYYAHNGFASSNPLSKVSSMIRKVSYGSFYNDIDIELRKDIVNNSIFKFWMSVGFNEWLRFGRNGIAQDLYEKVIGKESFASNTFNAYFATGIKIGSLAIKYEIGNAFWSIGASVVDLKW